MDDLQAKAAGMRRGQSAEWVFQATHWGEIVQGPVWFGRGLHTALITLPRMDRGATARFIPSKDTGVCVDPAHKTKSLRIATELLGLVGSRNVGGMLSVRSNVPQNGGAGSSTSDVTASARAVCRSLGITIGDQRLQHLVFSIEKAADPLVLMNSEGTVVYGSRCGAIIERVKRKLPRMRCLGFISDPTSTIVTDSLIGTEGYTLSEAIEFRRILDKAIKGIESGNVDIIGGAATASAQLNQHRIPTTRFRDLVQLAEEAGASGLAVSHSGVTATAIFDPQLIDLDHRVAWMAECLKSLGCTSIGCFPTC